MCFGDEGKHDDGNGAADVSGNFRETRDEIEGAGFNFWQSLTIDRVARCSADGCYREIDCNWPSVIEDGFPVLAPACVGGVGLEGSVDVEGGEQRRRGGGCRLSEDVAG